MALNDTALDVMGEALCSAITHIQLHSGAPGAAGTSNVISGGRMAVNLDSTDGDISLASAVNFTGMTPSATVANVSFWSASSGGTYYGFIPRTTGDATVNTSGEYTIATVSIPAAAT